MILFVGLGNPGDRYAGNRHNVGFMAVEAVAGRHRFSPPVSRFDGAFSEGDIGSQRVGILRPWTFMNDSGRAVAQAAVRFEIATSEIVVFHDELDLPLGGLRVKVGGGNAGHNGLRSISEHVGNDYRRVRIGIGHPGDRALVMDHVLQDFASDERGWVDRLCGAMADRAGLLAERQDPVFRAEVLGLVESAIPAVSGPALPG